MCSEPPASRKPDWSAGLAHQRLGRRICRLPDRSPPAKKPPPHMTVGDWSLRSAGQQVMVAGEREMVFLPSAGATEDQAVAQGGRADHHRGVRHCVRRRDRARRGITVLLYSCVTENLPPHSRITGTYHTRAPAVSEIFDANISSNTIGHYNDRQR